MKAQILKIAGVKSEKEFYKKYPTEEAFFAAHPEAQMMQKPTRQFGGDFLQKKQDEIMGMAKQYGPMLMQMAPMFLEEGGDIPQMRNGGYTVTRSHDRKGKTHKVTGPDGTVKYFGDSKLGQHPRDPERKKAFYARHKKNLDGNPFFRAFARATWADGGTPMEDDQQLTPEQKMQMRQQRAGQAVQAADVLVNAFMKKGGSTYSGGLWYQDGGHVVDSEHHYADLVKENPIKGFFIDGIANGLGLLDDGLTAAGKAVGRGIAPLIPNNSQLPLSERERIFNDFRPVEYPGLYNSGVKYIQHVTGWGDKKPPMRDWEGDYHIGEEAWRQALNLDTKGKYIQQSKYKPSTATDPNAKYYRVSRDVIDPQKFIDYVKSGEFDKRKQMTKNGKNEYVQISTLAPFLRENFMPEDEFKQIDPLQRFQIYRGYDEKKKMPYVSYSDIYDFDFAPANKMIKPFDFYDRFYYYPDKKKKGGSTYSGGVWFQNGGAPVLGRNMWMPQVSDADITKQATQDINQTNAMQPQVQQQPAAAGVFGQQLQNRVASENPAFANNPQQSNFNQKLTAIQNKLAEGMAGSPELDAIGSIIEGINNKKDYNAALDKQRRNYSTDYAYNTSYTTANNKGQYDMYGTMMPNQIGGNLSFSGMNQKYNMNKNMFELGGAYETSATSWIPKEIGTPRDEAPFFVAAPKANTFEMVPTKAAPAVENVTRMNFNLSGNFDDYAGKAQRYLDKVAPGTDIKGVDLAAAAQEAYKKHGQVVPVELALAQLKQEGYLAKGDKPNKPQRTKNPFNVGNTDSGAVVNHSSLYSGIQAYYDLMASQYLKTKSPQQLLQNFTNAKGNRYASDKRYEDSIRNIIGGMKLQQGGEVELTAAQIRHIQSMGGEVEFC